MSDKAITTCPRKARYRFTWPGRDEAFICVEHVGQLRNVAEAIGLPLQVIPLYEPEEMCPQCEQKVAS